MSLTNFFTGKDPSGAIRSANETYQQALEQARNELMAGGQYGVNALMKSGKYGKNR